jgi:hypothetical protein
MPGLSGDRSAVVVDDREVAPWLPRRLLFSSGFSAVCAVLVALLFALLSLVGSPLPGYLADHPAVVWLLSAGLFTVLWAHLGVLEYGRRDAQVRAAARRTARTSRAGATGPAGASGTRASCRRCPGLREENAALRAQLEAAQGETEALRDRLSSPAASTEVVVLEEQTTRETT